MRFLRTQVGNPRVWSDWKGNGLLPLVMRSLSRPQEAFWWLLSQLLRYSFCGICGNELEGLALIAQGPKSLFPCWPALYHLFCQHISPRVASGEQKADKGFNREKLDINWEDIRSTPGASPPCLSGRTQKEDSETPASVRDS